MLRRGFDISLKLRIGTEIIQIKLIHKFGYFNNLLIVFIAKLNSKDLLITLENVRLIITHKKNLKFVDIAVNNLVSLECIKRICCYEEITKYVQKTFVSFS